MTIRVSSNNKEKEAKRKNSVKKRDQTEKKQKTALPGVQPGLSARVSNSLTTLLTGSESFHQRNNSTCSHLRFTHAIRSTRNTADPYDTTTELPPINILPFKENY